MMIRYIKTKDNRIVKIDLENNGPFTGTYVIVGFPVETIEELIDCYVYNNNTYWNELFEFKNTKTKEIQNYESRIKITKETIKKGIYGAIWTDKGLIYVAKIKEILPNGKIDWELL